MSSARAAMTLSAEPVAMTLSRMVAVLVGVLVALDVEQLVQHELPVRGHLAADVAARILARERFGQQAELFQYLAQAGIVQLAPLAQAGQLRPGVVDD